MYRNAEISTQYQGIHRHIRFCLFGIQYEITIRVCRGIDGHVASPPWRNIQSRDNAVIRICDQRFYEERGNVRDITGTRWNNCIYGK